MRTILAIAAVVLLGAAPVAAQAVVCVNPKTQQVDRQATEVWQTMAERSDPKLMRQIAGTWYTVSAVPPQVSYQYQRYSADGFFDYQNRVCDTSTTLCSDYAGQGNYAVIGLTDGSMQFMTIVSDLVRDRECTGFALRLLNENTMQSATGGIMQRVR